MDPILSVRALAWRIGISAGRLREVSSDVASHYREKPLLDKERGKVRTLRIPDAELMIIQRRIKKRVLDQITLSKDAHGGVKGRSPRSNAGSHLGKACVVTLDVKKFFDEVRHGFVYRMFRHELGFGKDVAHLLTQLTTLRSRLPQGAATSTSVANLLLSIPVDSPISELAERVGVTYTRFVDDIALSGTEPRPLINVAARLLSHRGLRTYRKSAKHRPASKLRITPRSRPQEVTGLLVNSERGPSVSRKRRDGIRAAIFNLREMSDKSLVDTEVRSILGKIAHVRQFNPGEAVRLKRYLSVTLQVDS